MDTSTTYLGLRLAHPFMAGASPLGGHMDTAKRLEDGGCAALVLPSLFEEQITFAESGRIRHMDPLDPQFAGALADFPQTSEYELEPDEYLEHLRRLKQSIKIPVIASLNGTTAEAWLNFSRRIQEAGADGLELNIYEVVTNPDQPGVAVEDQMRLIVSELKRALKIPIAVKLSPFFTSFANVARTLDDAGANGLVIFNRFYQPDIDVRTLTVSPTLELSTSPELLLRLRWLALLHGRVRASLGVTGGVETPTDGIKALLAGAHAVQVVSAILRHGPSYFNVLRDGLVNWMEWQRISSIDEMRGRVSAGKVADRSAFERAHYIRTLHGWDQGHNVGPH